MTGSAAVAVAVAASSSSSISPHLPQGLCRNELSEIRAQLCQHVGGQRRVVVVLW